MVGAADDPATWDAIDSCDHAAPEIAECFACRSRLVERGRFVRALVERIAALLGA